MRSLNNILTLWNCFYCVWCNNLYVEHDLKHISYWWSAVLRRLVTAAAGAAGLKEWVCLFVRAARKHSLANNSLVLQQPLVNNL